MPARPLLSGLSPTVAGCLRHISHVTAQGWFMTRLSQFCFQISCRFRGPHSQARTFANDSLNLIRAKLPGESAFWNILLPRFKGNGNVLLPGFKRDGNILVPTVIIVWRCYGRCVGRCRDIWRLRYLRWLRWSHRHIPGLACTTCARPGCNPGEPIRCHDACGYEQEGEHESG